MVNSTEETVVRPTEQPVVQLVASEQAVVQPVEHTVVQSIGQAVV